MDLGLNLDTIRPVLGKYRSFVGRCCQKCTSKSWGCFFHKRLASMGFCNAISITEENTRYRGWLVRRLCHFLTVCEWRVSAEMPPNLQERLLRTPSPSILDCEKVECWPTSFQDVPLTSVEEQVLLDNLSLHTLSAGVSCSAIMAVHILSALLLHMHQEGVFLSRLMQDFVWITDEVLMRNYDVGFSGRVRDVLWHGLSLLRDCVTLYSLSLGDILVVPKKTEAAIRELGHHSTALLPVFIQEAIGACSINALLMEVLPYLGSPEQLGNFVLAHEELHNKSVLLVQLLPKDFLLRQPCESVHYYCQHTVDKLVESGLLVAEEVPSDCFMCDTVQKGFTEKFLWKATEDFVDIDGQDEAEKQCFKVFKEATEDNGPLLHLSDPFTARENQTKLEKFIHQFIY
ncbi:glycerol-3-phosphate acyltransferase 2, mitochondrial-like [Notechis scutatus]|uniref:Glycerol-3-phosphate acyltransferase 2, mitochondrial-like n=1 Tax=Notechis scutatus TaxID=8663 RepID=A0A6J1VZ58_9SAUR|nr:glycerol-3-phosphate acyltransferase 2, mitochondrial-like [Notechis scutatus]